jgi:hypothetical protein
MKKARLVTVVSHNDATLRGLESYLRGAGLITNGTRAVERIVEMTPPSSTAVILFPDEYGQSAVSAALAALCRERPEVLPVIVTNEPRRFEQPAAVEGSQPSPLVIPKPAWAWTILDAVRARLDTDASARGSSS